MLCAPALSPLTRAPPRTQRNHFYAKKDNTTNQGGADGGAWLRHRLRASTSPLRPLRTLVLVRHSAVREAVSLQLASQLASSCGSAWHAKKCAPQAQAASAAAARLEPDAFVAAVSKAREAKVEALWLDAWCYRQEGEYDHSAFCAELGTVMRHVSAVIWLPRSRTDAPPSYQFRLWVRKPPVG